MKKFEIAGVLLDKFVEKVDSKDMSKKYDKGYLVLSDIDGDKIKMDLFGKVAASVRDDFKLGDTVLIEFAVKSVEWKSKWFTNLSCIDISLSGSGSAVAKDNRSYATGFATADVSVDSFIGDDNGDQLPF